MATWGQSTIDEIFNGVAPLEIAKREDSDADVKEWLLRQVVPTLVKSFPVPDGEVGLLKWLVDTVHERLSGE